jgi:DNA-binding NarL/FixJ family response regulator
MSLSIIPKTLGMAILTLMIIAGFDIGLTESGRHLVVSVLNPQTEAPARPEVLVVAANRSDQLSVITTAEPRGYEVLLASSSKSGIQALDNITKQQLSIVVVDAAMLNSGAILRRVKSTYPKARIIMVDHNHSAVYLARQLLNAIAVA